MACSAASWLSWVNGGRCEGARDRDPLVEILRLTLGEVDGESVVFIWGHAAACGQRSTTLPALWRLIDFGARALRFRQAVT
jgi:hypothetical protein